MTKSARLLAGSTLAGPDVALLPDVDGVPFADWVIAQARSKAGVSRLAIQAAADQGPRAWRDYADQLARANGLRLVPGRNDDGDTHAT